MMIRNIWAVGRNYSDHAAEMKATPPSEPMIFLKAGSCATLNATEIELPYWTVEVHHEVELALKLSQNLEFIEGAVALDLTERFYQTKAKKEGSPWTTAKSFDGACALTPFFSLRTSGPLLEKTIKLWVNGELRQSSSLMQMIFKPDTILALLKERFPICAGDVILTGTPAGVGPLLDGDLVKVELSGEVTHQWKVRKAKAPVEEKA